MANPLNWLTVQSNISPPKLYMKDTRHQQTLSLLRVTCYYDQITVGKSNVCGFIGLIRFTISLDMEKETKKGNSVAWSTRETFFAFLSAIH